jgi:hypothetical protein
MGATRIRTWRVSEEKIAEVVRNGMGGVATGVWHNR